MSDKYLEKWKSREDVTARINYLKSHPDKIKKSPREIIDRAKTYNPRIAQGGKLHWGKMESK